MFKDLYSVVLFSFCNIFNNISIDIFNFILYKNGGLEICKEECVRIKDLNCFVFFRIV